MKLKPISAWFVIALIVLLGATMYPSIGRKLLFYPSHHPNDSGLAPWVHNGETIGYSRKVPSPKNVWLMLHGNGGQASDRIYAVPSFSADDSIFILEYPGFGNRRGTPSRESLDRAAKEAYTLLRETYPRIPVCVAAESIGSGPALTLAALIRPPDKFVLIVPFDRLSSVARDHFPSILVDLLLKDDWDNAKALSNYRGPVDIYGAEGDTIIPVRHAKSLATASPRYKLVIIPGGHNDWSLDSRVKIRNP